MAELEKIGVKVRRTIPAAKPQIFTPAMPFCLVGPCFQILDLYDDDGKLNSDALISVPAVIIGDGLVDPPGAAGKTLTLRIDAITKEIRFPQNLVTESFLLALLRQNFTNAYFEIFGGRLFIRTMSAAPSSYIEVVDGTAVSALGLYKGQKSKGMGFYDNSAMLIPMSALPNPNPKAKLSFNGLEDSVKVFYRIGDVIKAFSRDSALAAYCYVHEFTDATGKNWGFAYGTNYGNYLKTSGGALTVNLKGQSQKSKHLRKLRALNIGNANGKTIKVTSGEYAKLTLKAGRVPYATIIASDGSYGGYVKLNLESGLYPTEVNGWKVALHYDSNASEVSISLNDTAQEIRITYGPNTSLTDVVTAINSEETLKFNNVVFNQAFSAEALWVDTGATLPSSDAQYAFDAVDFSHGTVDIIATDKIFGARGNFRKFGISSTLESSPRMNNPTGGTDPDHPKTWIAYFAGQASDYKAHVTITAKGSLQGVFSGERGNIIVVNLVLGQSQSGWSISPTYTGGKLTRLTLTYNYTGSSIKPSDFVATITDKIDNIIDVRYDEDVDITSNTTWTLSYGADPTTQTLKSVLSTIDELRVEGLDYPLLPSTAEYLTGGADPIDFGFVGNFAKGFVTGGVNLASADAVSAVSGKNLDIRVNGVPYSIIFGEVSSASDIVSAINATCGTSVAKLISDSDESYLMLEAPDNFGLDSSVEIVGGTAVSALFGAPEDYIGVYEGCPMHVRQGDSLYDSGKFKANIVKVEDRLVGGILFKNSVLVLDTEIPVTEEISYWYIIGTGLPVEDAHRPAPEMSVSAIGNAGFVVLKPYIYRSPIDKRILTGNAVLYAAYKALRTDLSDGVLIDSWEALNGLKPFVPENPLGYASYLSYLAAGQIIAHYVVGVADISVAEPEGTFEAYLKAFDTVANKDVYVVVPLTFNELVHEALKEHVTTMSDEYHKRERIGIVCPKLPERAQPQVYGSGEAVKTTDDTITFDLNTLNVQLVMSELGIPVSQQQDPEIFYEKEIYINITSDNKNYLVKSVSGQSITVHTDNLWWLTHEGNFDGFYATSPLSEMQADGETCRIVKRGAPATTKTARAESMQQYAAHFKSSLMRVVGPDAVALPVRGTVQKVSGYFLAAIAAYQVSTRHPAVPLTGAVIPLVSDVYYPAGFTDKELGIAAAGGYSLAIRENDVVVWRDFVTTKTDIIQDFEHSMVVPDHYAAKIFRMQLLPFVGPLAIDSKYIAMVETVAQATAGKLVELGIYRDCSVKSVAAAQDDPRQLIVQIERTIYYPARGILVILI